MILQLLNREKTHYSSNLNREKLKRKLKDLFNQSSIDFSGKMSGHYFEVQDEHNVIGWHMPHFRRKSAYLKGEIVQNQENTSILLESIPNPVLPITALFSSLIGIIVLILAFQENIEASRFLWIGSVFMVYGLVYFALSSFFKHRLRKKIAHYLHLEKMS